MELDQVMQALREADRRAQSGDAQAVQDARRLAQIAQRLQSEAPRQGRDPALSQINLGIADAVGGLVDLVNPFDQPHALNPFPEGTGSARQGLVNVMQATGAAGEDRAPEGIGEAVLRGSGQAAGAVVPTGAAATTLSRAPGMIGQAADTVRRGLTSNPAVVAEVTAGGVSGGAMEVAEQAGLPEWAQALAGIAAPTVALPAATYATNRTVAAARNFSPAVNAGRAVTGAVAPYTRRGAEALARRRLEDLAGGRERAIELGEAINPNDEFGLTPAQQTGDRGILALEQLAASQNPILRERLDRQFSSSMGAARQAVGEVGGEVADAQAFIRERRAQFTTEMRQVANQAVRNAEERLASIQGQRTDGDNSLIVMDEIRRAREAATTREAELWAAVPVVAQVGTDNARSAAQGIVETTARAQSGDIPQVVRSLLLDEEGGLGPQTTVRELHGLYSALREEARNAMAGTQVNRNRARIANEVADAILQDLGAVDATTAVGRAINEARTFSSALHETFDRGAYARLSRRTVEGDTATDPELALERTVGRGGETAQVGARQLEAAGAGLTEAGGPARPNPAVGNAIADYIRGQFSDRAFDAQGAFTRRGAAEFVRRNAVLLDRYPDLRGEIDAAVSRGDTAQAFSNRISERIGALEDARRSTTAGFVDAAQENAIRSIIEADNPVRAAQALVNAARRDGTGAALEGVKASFSGEIIRRALRTQDGQQFLDADAMLERMSDPRFRSAMNRVLNAGEIRRLEEIVRVVQRLNQSQVRQPSIGESLSGAQSPRFVQVVARIAGAQAATRTGAGSGNAGTSLQAANLGAGTANQIVDRLTADRASQILMDAVTDPRLMQALLMDPASPRFEREALPRLIPYLVGASAAVATPDE